MRFVSFEFDDCAGYGILQNRQIFQFDANSGAPSDLKALLPSILDKTFSDFPTGRILNLDEVRLLPPVPNPGKIFCVATNFHESSQEGKPVPEYPLLFSRCAEAQTGHGSPIFKPAVSEKFDFEGELAVIIGKWGHKIPRSHAMEHVAGYSCYNDGSVRDWQKHSTQFTPGKNFFQSAGFGPWMVCTEEILDPKILSLETRVNGELKQSITMNKMVFDIPWLITYISTFTPLTPGDVIVTGTPSGFGSSRNPPEFLKDGDRIDVAISGVGNLTNTVKQDIDVRGNLFS